MRISTMFGLMEKFFLNGRKLTEDEKAIVAMILQTKINDKTKQPFKQADAAVLESAIESARKATHDYYLALAKEYE